MNCNQPASSQIAPSKAVPTALQAVGKLGKYATWLLLISVAACWPQGVASQRPLQFIPDGLVANIPSRLVFRTEGLVEAWKDSDARTAVLSGDINIDPTKWRQAFASTGGVAVVGPGLGAGVSNFTITGEFACLPASDCPSTAESNSSSFSGHGRASLHFNQMPYTMMIGPGGLLQFQNIALGDIAASTDYVYSPAQPYKEIVVGSDMWPTVGLAPNSTLKMVNVTVSYRNTAPDLSCEERVGLGVYSLQQLRGRHVVVRYNRTAGRIPGTLKYTVQILNGSDNTTLGDATVVIQNLTFNCLPNANSQQLDDPLSVPQLAAAVTVPVGLAAVALIVWCSVRRHQRSSAAAAGRGWCCKDIESANADRWDLRGPSCTARKHRGHSGSSNGQPPPPADVQHQQVELVDTTLNTRAVDGSSRPSLGCVESGQHPASTGVHGSSLTAEYCSVHSSEGGMPVPAASNLGAAAAQRDTSLPRELVPSHTAFAPVVLQPPATAQSLQPPAGCQLPQPSAVLQAQCSLASTHFRSISDEVPAHTAEQEQLNGAGQQGQHTASSAGGSSGATVGYSRHTAGSGANQHYSGPASSAATVLDQYPLTASIAASEAGIQPVGMQGLVHSGSSRAPGGAPTATADTKSGRSSTVPALLKARSDMAVLRDLKVGPLLGRGSYGRVYKGRWKSVTVAVKILEHRSGASGTTSCNSTAKQLMVGRETALAASMAHPNVVQTFHVSTMTLSQRSGITSYLEGDAADSDGRQGPKQLGASEGDDEGGSSSSDDDERRDPLETWMIMEFCEKGSLEKAYKRGKFITAAGEPDMIGIYKALLDTASGLDYLHSIGVVHGDLKTANVLLKGSTRDVRGFACKITDFGLSRVLDLDATHISTRTYGTITYMPREMLLTGHMSAATDIYSFSLMMWELITSSSVFEDGMSIGQMFYMIAYGNWRPHIPDDCPRGYAALMSACWHQDPEQRPTAQQVLRTLQKLYADEKQAAAATREAAGAARDQGAKSAYQDWAPANGDERPLPSAAPTVAISEHGYVNSRQPADSQVLQQRSCVTISPAGNFTTEAQSEPAAPTLQQQQQQLQQQPQQHLPAYSASGGYATSTAVLAGAGPQVTTQACVAAAASGDAATSAAAVGSAGTATSELGQQQTPAGMTAAEAVAAYRAWVQAANKEQQQQQQQQLQRQQQQQQAAAAAPDFTRSSWQYSPSFSMAVLQQTQQEKQQRQQQWNQPMADPGLVVSSTAAAAGLGHPLQASQHADQLLLHRQLSSYYHIRNSLELQPSVDNEPLPSDSLFRADTIPSTSTCHHVSSSSNALVPDAEALDLTVSGQLGDCNPTTTGVMQQLPLAQQHQQQFEQQQQQAEEDQEQWASADHPNHSAAAAQSFLQALEMVTRPASPGAAPAAAQHVGLPALNVGQMPYHYQQRPMLAQHLFDTAVQPYWGLLQSGASGVVSSSLSGPDTPGGHSRGVLLTSTDRGLSSQTDSVTGLNRDL